VGMMDGTVQVVKADMAGTVRELFSQLAKELKLNIISPEWKLFAHYGEKAPETRFDGGSNSLPFFQTFPPIITILLKIIINHSVKQRSESRWTIRSTSWT
jgi:hypothetical protein